MCTFSVQFYIVLSSQLQESESQVKTYQELADKTNVFPSLKKIDRSTVEDGAHILHHIDQAQEVTMTIVYTNGSSLLREPTDKMVTITFW